MSALPISADSHAVEMPEVFAGLADRFGDAAPRVMDVGERADCIVVPERGQRGVPVAQMCMASTRLKRDEPLSRKHAHKPDVANLKDPELVELFARGYAAMRPGLTDGSRRGEDQDVDGLAAEFLYPGYFAMFNFPNVELLIALQNQSAFVFDDV